MSILNSYPIICMCTCFCVLSVHATGNWQSALDALGLLLLVLCSVWMLVTKPGSSARLICTVSHPTLSPA